MKIRISPDKQKSESLKKMAEITLKRLKETDIQSYPSNTLLDYYDIIHKIIEAIALSKGVKIKGEGAHKELIDYMVEKGTIDELTRRFLQEMRDYRNRISYEGFMIHKNYVNLNKEKIQRIIKNLFKVLEND